jgi:hypothetical protein
MAVAASGPGPEGFGEREGFAKVRRRGRLFRRIRLARRLVGESERGHFSPAHALLACRCQRLLGEASSFGQRRLLLAAP